MNISKEKLESIISDAYESLLSKIEDEKIIYKFLDKCKKSEYKIAHMFDKTSFRKNSRI